MIYRESAQDLLKEGLIKKCRIDEKAVLNLIRRARKDIETAARNLSKDEDCAYSYAYNSMLRSGLALMMAEGFRPDIKDKHLTVVKFTASILGTEFKRVINDYDFMRRKRHRLVYEPDIPCSSEEARRAIQTAIEFVDAVCALLTKKNPQLELQFK
ncbi:MAG: HEPN domain-containing protein [Candidatus Aminicenantales bacterium]